MKAACSSCGAQHSLPDAQLVGRPRVQFCCAKCGKTTLVEVAQNPDATQVLSPLPEFARSAGAPRLARGRIAALRRAPGVFYRSAPNIWPRGSTRRPLGVNLPWLKVPIEFRVHDALRGARFEM